MKKTNQLIILATSIVFLAACDNGGGEIAKPESEAWRRNAEQMIRNQLKDPSSAQFKDVSCINAVWCTGYVNAKNSFGGYVGFKKFSVTNTSGVVIDD
jgi:hypothetical protein